ncbi:sugar-binding transcriptional regulator [Gemmobacter denitrificans]|uniref:Sugar-binding transcriptional regulator n=1 Tax=Gemmobacter denitrificans TaxID=3123040 RepID=A0ABU8BSM4_9RHOB
METENSLLDAAARAGWLYYVGGMTQDQIATELGVSRQRAQRLVSKAMAEGLIRVRLDHKIGRCLELEAQLVRHYGLQRARVAPDLGAGAEPARATAATAATLLESFLARAEPQTIAVGTGRALSAMVGEIVPQRNDRHRIVSLIGNIAPDGAASFYDVIMLLADRLHAPHYPMPAPLISETPEERAMFHALRPVQTVANLARKADVYFVGIGQMDETAPLFKDGFITRSQLADMQAKGAVGEIVGGVYGAEGRYIETPISALVGGVRIEPGHSVPVVGVAAGQTKVAAIRAALKGRIINSLVTDEPTAAALLA